MSQTQQDAVAKRLEQGLKDRWYALCPSSFVKEKPVSFNRLGTHLAVWRGTDGKVHALEDRCPHRGAKLSQGTILNDTLKPGMALVIRYEGPKGGPGMQEMLYPTSFVKGKGIGKQVAMLTDGRYSGGSSGLAIGHMAPEAANKGPVALIKNGDIIDIDIEARSVNVELTDEQLDERRRELEAGDGYVAHRNRHVSQALKAYAAFARSADKGATRDPELINKLSGLD